MKKLLKGLTALTAALTLWCTNSTGRNMDVYWSGKLEVGIS